MMPPRLLPAYRIPEDQPASRALLVNQIRNAVHRWRREQYPGVTDTSRLLLTHWFEKDHQNETSGEPWLYYYCQREAVEATIYLYEVLKQRNLYGLFKQFPSPTGQHLAMNPLEDRWTRYAYKMATGSGKTKVMSLLIAWSYFNAIREYTAHEYSKTFLIIAPNVIVYERLKQDFGDGGAIFREDPVIPPEWADQWQLEVVTRDEPNASFNREGALFLTNIQQMYDRATRSRNKEPQQLRDIIGEPVVDSDISAGRLIRQSLERRNDLMILNDEGHHVHNRRMRWWETIESLHNSLQNRRGSGLAAQLDFSATPKHNDGKLFNHIIVDYPIAQAMQDGVVKRAHLVMLEGAETYQLADAADRYRDKLVAAIKHWSDLRDRMKDTGRTPLLFIMAENTKSANEIATWLTEPGKFDKDEILLIHTNARGDITEGVSASKQREIASLREAARQVDSENSPYKVIVSVLMLREGWDVKNVCVIVPLRPYSAASQILPEQTLGRGLRRMFPLNAGDEREELLVIEHEAFQSFWETELEEEDLNITITPEPQFRQNAATVLVDHDKVPEFDIEIPRLSPSISQKHPDLSNLDIHQLPRYRMVLPMQGLAEAPMPYTTRAMDTWEVVDHGEIERDFPMTEIGYLNYITRLILKECRLSNLSNGFAQLAPIIKTYIQEVMLSNQAALSDTATLHRLNDPQMKNWMLETFVNAINKISIQENEVRDQQDPILVSQTRPFLTRRRTYRNPSKSIFNHVPADSDLELHFARWLDSAAEDVAAFAKNESAIGFNVNYVSPMGGLRTYMPDFIVRTTSDDMHIIETKGLETQEVPSKDARIRQWCADASALSHKQWSYIKVADTLFRSASWQSLYQLANSS